MEHKKLTIEYLGIDGIKPYEKNPRKNKQAIEIVMKSIQEFGFKNPIILDKENVIVAGHTRLEAAKRLGLKEVPTIKAEELTKNQIKAFRIMDNKSAEYADWDYDLLMEEIEDLKEDEDFNLETIGFSKADLDNIEKQSEKALEEIDEDVETEFECPKCGYKY